MSKTLICIPCMDMVPTAFMQSLLGLKIVGEAGCSIKTSSLIYDARNLLCKEAVEGGYDRMMWLDSDMVFEPDIMERLSQRLDEGKDIVTALCFRRKPPIKPTIYKEVGFVREGNETRPAAIYYEDYPKDSLFEVKGFGFACVMMKTEIAERVAEKYRLPFSPALGFGEDLSFCGRLSELGVKLWCDSSIKVGHIAQHVVTENDYERIRENENRT